MAQLNSYDLSPAQRDKVACLVRLAERALAALHVSFTAAHLEEVVMRSFATLTSRQPIADDPAHPQIVNWSDPSNLAVILLDALRSYHVRYDLSVRPAEGDTEATLAVLRATRGVRYAALLGVATGQRPDGVVLALGDGSQRIVPDEAGDVVEHFVILKRSVYSLEPEYAAHTASLRIKRYVLCAAAAAATATIAAVILVAWGDGIASLALPTLAMLAAGTFVCYELLRLTYALGGDVFLQNLCGRRNGRHRTHGGLVLDCQAVLDSKAARIASNVRLADVGMVYFAGLLSVTVLGVLAHDFARATSVVFWATMLAAPYSLYLVVYQLAVTRALCVLCTAAQALIGAHAVYLLSMRGRFAIAVTDVGAVSIWLLVTLAATTLYVVTLRGIAARREAAALRLERHKSHVDVAEFDAAARRELAFPDPSLPGVFVLGDAHAPLRLGAVLSPTCAPCALRLTELRKIVDWFDGHIAVTVLIKADEHTRPIAEAVLHAALENDHGGALTLLERWYRHMTDGASTRVSLDAFLAHETACDGRARDHVRATYAQHERWLAAQYIPHTPLLFHRGRIIPPNRWDTDVLIAILEQRQEQLETQRSAPHEPHREPAWTKVSHVA